MTEQNLMDTRRQMPKEAMRFVLKYGAYIVGVVMFAFFSFSTNAFFTVSNILGVLRDSVPMLVTATGMTFVLLGKRMDLSLASNLLLSSSIGAMGMAYWGWSPVIAIVISVTAGGLIGAWNGLMIVKLNMNGWLTTLAMQLLLKGICYWITSSKTILVSNMMGGIAKAQIAGMPIFALIAFLLVVLAQYLITYTTFGRRLIALGCNEQAAQSIGVNTKRVSFLALTIAGAFAAIGGIMMMLNMGEIGPTSGKGYEFVCCMCCVLGGTSLYGGQGSVLPGTLVGVLIVMFLENGLYIMGVNPYVYGLVRGAILFYAMFIDSIKNKSR